MPRRRRGNQLGTDTAKLERKKNRENALCLLSGVKRTFGLCNVKSLLVTPKQRGNWNFAGISPFNLHAQT